jgi:hypothetical protein
MRVVHLRDEEGGTHEKKSRERKKCGQHGVCVCAMCVEEFPRTYERAVYTSI